MNSRRYDIDWLRVIAIGFLLIYHIAIPFQPWGVFIGFIQSPETLESIWGAMSFLNIWRIPLLFFVSGMGVYFSMRKRNWKGLLRERSIRILIPLLAGSLLVVPLQNVMWQVYYSQDIKPVVFPAHLWFLANIFSYVIILMPVFFYLKKHEERLKARIERIMNHPIKLLLFSLPFVGATMLIQPEAYTMYAYTLNGYVLGFFAFFFGFLFVYSGECFWSTLHKWKWMFSALGTLLFVIRLVIFEMESPLSLMAFETVIWIYAILGVGYSHLNFSNKYLPYLSEAAYPVYIVHWVFIHLSSMYLFPLSISPWLKLLGVTLFTFAGSLAFYHFVLRNVHFLRPLFGLKRQTEKKHLTHRLQSYQQIL